MYISLELRLIKWNIIGGRLKSTLACLMSGNNPIANDVSSLHKSGIKKSRRKRSVSSEKLGYGKCPKDFIKISEYLCVHMHKDKRGIGFPSLFDDANKYCKKKAPGASLLYFLNEKEALDVWKWLGKLIEYLIIPYTIIFLLKDFFQQIIFYFNIISI